MAWLASAAVAADPPLQPVRVCEVLSNPTQYEGKVVAMVGRFSFRATGRTLNEETCDAPARSSFKVTFDKVAAPKTPEHLDIDSAAVTKLMKAIQVHTALAKFRFGTPDFDRWAVVYGRVDLGKRPEDAAQVVCAGDGVVMFLVDRY